MLATSIIDKYLPNSTTYPIILLPQLIRDNYPQAVQINRQIFIDNPSPNIDFQPSKLVFAISAIFLLCTLVLLTRILNLHQNSGITIAAMTTGAIDFGWGLWQLDKVETAHQRRIAAQNTGTYQTLTTTVLTYPNWEKILTGKVRQPCSTKLSQTYSSPTIQSGRIPKGLLPASSKGVGSLLGGTHAEETSARFHPLLVHRREFRSSRAY
jgi:hypothetical protein